jgi:hypothetical protein
MARASQRLVDMPGMAPALIGLAQKFGLFFITPAVFLVF